LRRVGRRGGGTPCIFESLSSANNRGGSALETVRTCRSSISTHVAAHFQLPLFMCMCTCMCLCVRVFVRVSMCMCVHVCVPWGGERGCVCVCVCAIEPLHHHAHAACLQLLKYMCIFMYDMLTPAQQCCHSVCRIYLL